MKKLMMLTAIALAVASANAASFAWKTGNYTNVLNPDGSAVTTADGYTSLMNGGKIVLVLLDSEKLYTDTASLYRLNQSSGRTGMTSGGDLGPLPAGSKALLITLCAVWLLLGARAVAAWVKRKG